MRSARAKDHWRHLADSSRSRALKLVSLSFTDAMGIGNGVLPLHPALTVVCGPNGAGKSTLLTVAGLACDFNASAERDRDRHARINLSLELITARNGALHLVVQEGAWTADHEVEVHRLDPGTRWFKLKSLVEGASNWNELLEQHGPTDLESRDLADLSYLVGKNYTSCRLYEIEEYNNDESAFPYCVVRVGEREYGFEEMGAGEGALFLTWWHLRNIQGPSILLLEEPETHITPRSQKALMDVLAELCGGKVSCVLTTHSADVVSCVPKECIRLVMPDTGGIRILEKPSNVELLTALGMEVRPALVAFVEDECDSPRLSDSGGG